MTIDILIFIAALSALLVSANYFTNSAETIGKWLNLPQFVVGVFIIGMGTSLPELVSGILSIQRGASEILPGNIIGANISNLLLVTGVAIVLNKKVIDLGKSYIYIDLHFLLGSFFILAILAFDGIIEFSEAFVGILAYVVYAFYLIRGNKTYEETVKDAPVADRPNTPFPTLAFLIIVLSSVGIYFGADYTISSISSIATILGISPSIIALTVLSLGTTLPELAVNISVIKKGKAELAIGNVLGSCIFNSLMIPAVASSFGAINVPDVLISFSLPVMVGAGLFFYLLAQDKRMSTWEGLLFIIIYILFILKISVG